MLSKNAFKVYKVSLPAISLPDAAYRLRAQGTADPKRQAVRDLFGDLIANFTMGVAIASGAEVDWEEHMLGGDERANEVDRILLRAVHEALAVYKK